MEPTWKNMNSGEKEEFLLTLPLRLRVLFCCAHVRCLFGHMDPEGVKAVEGAEKCADGERVNIELARKTLERAEHLRTWGAKAEHCAVLAAWGCLAACRKRQNRAAFASAMALHLSAKSAADGAAVGGLYYRAREKQERILYTFLESVCIPNITDTMRDVALAVYNGDTKGAYPLSDLCEDNGACDTTLALLRTEEIFKGHVVLDTILGKRT